MNYILGFISALILSFIFSKILIRLGLRFNIVSKPRERDVHFKPIPRIGGVAIIITFLLVASVVFIFNKDLYFGGGHIIGIDRRFFGIILGGIFVGVSMLIDDIYGLKAWQKLIIQITAALIVISSGVGIDHLPNPFGEQINLNSIYIPLFRYHGIMYHFSLLSDLLTLFWVVGMMNIINFVDGVDGLAGGLAEIACFTVFLLSVSLTVMQPATAMVSIILAGSVAGFLLWNFPPAKIFMGDSGSMFLGFMLGLLPLISGGKLATIFLVLGFPILDGVIVIFSRILKGKNPATTPDKTHLHHRFLDAGFSPRQAVITMYIISICFSWVALRSTTFSKAIAAVCLIVLVFILLLVLTAIKNAKINKGKI